MSVKWQWNIWIDEVKKELKILRKRPMCWLAIGFLLIICIFLVGRSYKEVLYQENVGNVYLEGYIADKQYKESGYGAYWQITLKKVKVQNDEKIETLDGKYLCQLSSAEDTELKIGQKILLSGNYTPWEEPSNPGQFNSGKYYCSQGIWGQFKKCKIIRQSVSYSKFREDMWNLRQQINDFLCKELGEEEGALIAAMVLGEKGGLKEEDKSLYQRNGISHILAISGLHLMLLGMGVFRTLKVILGGDRQGAVAGIIIMSCYCVFTGNSISTIRATIMFALSLSAKILGRSYDSLSALGLAAIVQLFVNPYVLNNSGFLLSFLAVIGVTFLAPRLQEIVGAKRKFTKSICISLASVIATLPVLLCNYGTYPWYSIFLNMLILPAMSVLLLLAVVLVLTGIQPWFGRELIIVGIKFILKYFEICCKLFEKIPFQDGYLGAPGVLQIVLYIVLVITAISRWFKYSVFIKKMMLVSALVIVTLRFNFGTEITMLDVGQGDGIVIRNSNGNVYISDCGSSSVSKVGKYRLIPYLKYKGYGRIKGIFVSHLDQDHMNGIVEILRMAPEERIRIEYLLLPRSVLMIEEDEELLEELQLLAEKNKTKLIYLAQGDRVRDGHMEFLCLYPEVSNIATIDCESGKKEKLSSSERNNQSLVLLMKYHDFDILLTGDVEKEGEKKILTYIDRMGLWPDGVDVLKVAHHGSSGSSAEEFLEIFHPKLSLISCGKYNSYGHPHAETLDRLEHVQSEIRTTADEGAITINVNNCNFSSITPGRVNEGRRSGNCNYVGSQYIDYLYFDSFD
ncbi:MAG: DNA internalization-related competence protein ComEC/Rec2 [Lachnospiraceae bacterium]|nr:DNA internalization-related competence protein ComEC/Rec2 [Lachnospiraceae bacterium]